MRGGESLDPRSRARKLLRKANGRCGHRCEKARTWCFETNPAAAASNLRIGGRGWASECEGCIDARRGSTVLDRCLMPCSERGSLGEDTGHALIESVGTSEGASGIAGPLPSKEGTPRNIFKAFTWKPRP